jgi:peptidoglycan/LPS O-acetylase OafA/YrhL
MLNGDANRRARANRSASGAALTRKRRAGAAVSQSVSKNKRLPYLDFFRGVAILQIVVLHAGRALFNRGYAAPIPDSHVAFATIDIFFHNATVYFTLISSIIFAHVFAAGNFVAFLKSRMLNVAAPYVVVSAALTVLLALRGGSPAELDIAGIVGEALYNIGRGSAWNQLWYIPIILALYVLTPTLYALARAPQARLAVALIIVSPLAFSRTGTELSMGTLIYFAGPYMLGLLIGCDPERWLDRFARHIPALTAAALATTAALYVLYFAQKDFIGPVSLRESLYYIQKLALGGLLLVGLRAWSRMPGRIRDKVLGLAASTSFGVYFIHAPALRPIADVIGGFSSGAPSLAVLAGSILLASAAAVLFSWIVIWVARRVFGKRSRLIVGA